MFKDGNCLISVGQSPVLERSALQGLISDGLISKLSSITIFFKQFFCLCILHHNIHKQCFILHKGVAKIK